MNQSPSALNYAKGISFTQHIDTVTNKEALHKQGKFKQAYTLDNFIWHWQICHILIVMSLLHRATSNHPFSYRIASISNICFTRLKSFMSVCGLPKCHHIDARECKIDGSPISHTYVRYSGLFDMNYCHRKKKRTIRIY